MSPCTEDIISIVRISSEANTIASLEKCFTAIDKEIEELNKKSQKFIINCSNKRHKFIISRSGWLIKYSKIDKLP